MADRESEAGRREPGDLLRAYRAKRSPDRTPEPFGAAEAGGDGGLFVVHKHAARRLHYDLRLEMEGGLGSWAGPKGPACDTKEKRLPAPGAVPRARPGTTEKRRLLVFVEDPPLE